MAYVVARPNGRFEIRESVHTAKGPRARSLANFAHLTDDVLVKAAKRATRPFDPVKVRAAATLAGLRSAPDVTGSDGRAHLRPEMRQFVAASRQMARSLERVPELDRPDPGDALIELLDFVAQVQDFQPARTPEPLRFPPLARLMAARAER